MGVKYMSIRIERGKLGQLLLSFDYNEEIIKKIKTIRGREWNPEEKKWIVPDNESTINRINELFLNTEIVDYRQSNDNDIENDFLMELPKHNYIMDMLRDNLKLGGFSTKTIKSYLGHLFTIYSAGLRVGEVVRLKINDIDSERMLIHIVQGKGKKDRYTTLSEVALVELRNYVKEYKPSKWLFPGQNPKDFITERTVQRVFENAKIKAGIKKNVSVHSLRHSFATHLLEGGIDLRYIQELLGHSSSKTTEIYTHVTKKSIQNIVSPLDVIVSKHKRT